MGHKFIHDAGIEKGIGTVLMLLAVCGFVCAAIATMGNVQRHAERAAARTDPAHITAAPAPELGHHPAAE